MLKKPIAVTAASSEQKLHYMSRINFGKPYTVEWNVKVMNVGKVHENSMVLSLGTGAILWNFRISLALKHNS